MSNWKLMRRKNALHHRARVIQSIREFFIAGGFLEIETPFRIPAPAPESHIEAIESEGWFLQTSPELCMKRLLSAGYERLFQICRCWRHSERGERHLPEFTMLEWYRADADYRTLMADCESLLQYVAERLEVGGTIRIGDREITLHLPWERLTVQEAFERHGAVSMDEALAADLFDEVMVRDIEPNLGWNVPVFLHDYPAVRGALARTRQDDPTVAERFELYAGGLELANGFSELTDAVEQRARFEEEITVRSRYSRKTYPMPEKFLAELPSMPESAGIALGVDRLVMVMLNLEQIDDVVAFTPEEL
jgi:elongation factor P--(R)-beta-lysine ligase